MTLKRNHNKEKGFTLVELSIVLVIIGLIVSGVLVGQDLIQAAQIRSQIRQIQDLDTATNTFRSKYNGLPGDLNNGFEFGLVAGSAAINGNGDGLIDGSVAAAAATDEAARVFESLGNAQLVAGRFATSATPPTKLDRGRLASVSVSDEGINLWVLGAAGTDAATTAATVTSGTGYTGFESWSIDQRMDDGLPNTGIMRSGGAGVTFTGGDDMDDARGAPSTTNCVEGTAEDDAYIITTSGTAAAGNVKTCSLFMRMSG